MVYLDVAVKLFTLILGFGAVAKWIVHRIERGQKQIITEHRRDFRMMKKELKKRISRDECERLRAQCPCKREEAK